MFATPRGQRLAVQLTAHRLEERAVPATITVGSNQDNLIQDGKVTLREALESINSGKDFNSDLKGAVNGIYGTADTVVFAGGLAGLTIALGQELGILNAVTISAPNAEITVSGNNSVRVFHILLFAANDDVTINGLRIANGRAPFESGGGINNENADLTLVDCTVSGNKAGIGGGIYSTAFGGVVPHDLTLERCQVNSNYVYDGGNGGGISFAGGNLTISNSRISNNQLKPNAYAGGGIFVGLNSSTTISASTIEDNKAGFFGGGLYALSPIALLIENSEVSGNEAVNGNADGGGIFVYGGSPVIRNCTISGNCAARSGGGILLKASIDPVIYNSTIAFNEANCAFFQGTGGGIATQDVFNLTLDSTIVAKNLRQVHLMPSLPDDIDGGGNAILGTNSLILDVNGWTFGIGSQDNITGTDPLLFSLANNGGTSLTETHALAFDPAFPLDETKTSVAIDAANPVNPQSLVYDQRGTGFAREVAVLPATSRARPDIGGFEVQAAVAVLSVIEYDDSPSVDDLPSNSVVNKIKVTFNQTVAFSDPATAFKLDRAFAPAFDPGEQQGVIGRVFVDVTQNEGAGVVTFTFPFIDPIPFGFQVRGVKSNALQTTAFSLPDGTYQFNAFASKISSKYGTGNLGADFKHGDAKSLDLYRYFGDADADGDADAAEFLAIRDIILGIKPYNAQFDYDSDGDVDNADFLEFRDRFNNGPLI